MLEFVQYFVLFAIANALFSYVIVEIYEFFANTILDCFDLTYDVED